MTEAPARLLRRGRRVADPVAWDGERGPKGGADPVARGTDRSSEEGL